VSDKVNLDILSPDDPPTPRSGATRSLENSANLPDPDNHRPKRDQYLDNSHDIALL
jgi:hypothetical protein